MGAYCSVVGLRPTPGIVPIADPPSDPSVGLHAVVGPMARSVSDLALLMDAISTDQTPSGGRSYYEECENLTGRLPKTVAWSGALGGQVPMEEEVAELAKKAAMEVAALSGAAFIESCIDLSSARATFHVLRAEMFRDRKWILSHSDIVKPELIWQIQRGLNLKEEELREARANQADILRSTARFFESYDLLCSPCTMTPPFDVSIRWLKGCAGWELESYIDWLMPTSLLSLTNCPSICVPCGFTQDEGLPVGLHILAAPGKEAELMCTALAYEKAGMHKTVVPVENPGERSPAL